MDASDSSGEQLIGDASKGDALAINALLEQHLPGLRAFIRLRAGERFRAKESASDLVQTVCREVLQHISRFKHNGEAGFKQWLYTTALRKIMDRHRYYGRDKRNIDRDVGTPGRQSDEAQLVEAYATFHTPSRDAMLKEEIARVEDAFDDLPEDYREVITLNKIVGLSHRDIAEEMGRSEEAVRKTLSRAMARLSRILRSQDSDA